MGPKEDTHTSGTKNSFDVESIIKKSVDYYSSEKGDSMKFPKEREFDKGFKPVKPSNDYEHSSFDHKEGRHETKSSKIPQSAQDLIDSIEKYKTQSKGFDDTPTTKQEKPTKSPRTPKSTQELLDSMEKYKKQQSHGFDEKGKPTKQDKPIASPRTPQSAQDLIDSIEKYKSQSKEFDVQSNKPIKQERPTKSPRSQQKSDPNSEEKARERPTKSPRAPQPSKDSMDKYGREKSFDKEKPVKQERPTKSPRPTQSVSKDSSSKNEEHSKPTKQEKPTKSPRPSKPKSQKFDHQESIQNKSQEKTDDKYNKNLSKFDDLLQGGPKQTKGPREDERLHEKAKLPKDRGSEQQQQEIDDLFNIGGRSSSIRSSSKDDKNERAKTSEQQRKDSKFERKDSNIKSKDSEPSNKNNKSRDYKDSNKDVNKSQEKSLKPKQGLSRQDRFDQESRQKLRQMIVDDEEEVRHPKRIPDEQIDSLFDAGSKRTASVRKEKVKSDKLKEHVRRSNESLRRTMDEEIVEKDRMKRKDDKARGLLKNFETFHHFNYQFCHGTFLALPRCCFPLF